MTVTPLLSLFISSPEGAHLPPSTCKLLLMFLHLILCCPSPYCIPDAVIKCRITILISYFPCLTARFFPREDCSIRPHHSLPTLGSEIALSTTGRMLATSFASSPQCAFTLTKKVAVPAAILFHSISMAAARIYASGAPTNNLSACHEAPGKMLPIQTDLSWPGSPLPLVPLCTAAFSFFFSSYYNLLPFCPFCLNCHLPVLGPETHSLHPCLSLCPSCNRVLSLSIGLDIRLFPLILRPLTSKLLFARLPHGNLGEPNTKHTLRSLSI